MRRTLTAVTLIGLAGAAWFVIRRSTDVSLPEPTVAVGLRADCAAVDSADYFFPPQIFRPWAGSLFLARHKQQTGEAHDDRRRTNSSQAVPEEAPQFTRG